MVLVLIFGGAALSDGDESPKADAADGASSVADEDSAEPTPHVDVQEAKPTPPKSTIPRVSGLAGKQAKRKLAAVGWSPLSHARFRHRDRPGLSCVSSRPRDPHPEGSSVGLVIAAPYPMVPGPRD